MWSYHWVEMGGEVGTGVWSVMEDLAIAFTLFDLVFERSLFSFQ
jgi:hypothetical protein